MTRGKKPVLWLLLILTNGCAQLSPRQIAVHMERPASCQELFTRLDETVAKAGVRDAASFTVVGFPYLRTNRFLTALNDQVRDPAARQQWLELMQQLDLQARELEILNLPDTMLPAQHTDAAPTEQRDQLREQVRSCSASLLQHDQAQPGFWGTLTPRVRVPDEYSYALQAIGLYPLTSIPVALLTERVRREFLAWYQVELKDLPVRGVLTRYAPVGATNSTPGELRAILTESSGNPLQVPLLTADQAQKVAAHFAPVLVQDVAADHDRPGRLVARDHALAVDPEQPTVYYYLSHALRQRPLLQINYVIWYAKRAGNTVSGGFRGPTRHG